MLKISSFQTHYQAPVREQTLSHSRGSLSLEDLPNELFFEIFRYLNGLDAIAAFDRLNRRFHYLLLTYVKKFDFRSVSKDQFLYVMRMYKPSQWRSLALSDAVPTPGQIQLFLHLISPEDEDFALEYLTMNQISPINVKRYFAAINSFNQLVSLSIGPVCGLSIGPLELPLLKRLAIQSCKNIGYMQVGSAPFL